MEFQPDILSLRYSQKEIFNLRQVFLRLMKEIKTIDSKKYISLEEIVDEIGRMLGGWIKSTKD